MAQITFQLTDKEKDIIKRGAEVIGVGYSSFLKALGLERARELLLKNNLKVD
jgi:uncharacterized protein (DUF1778 family)